MSFFCYEVLDFYNLSTLNSHNHILQLSHQSNLNQERAYIILTSIFGKNYPVLDPFSHASGHLWVALAGGSPVLFNILHPLSNVLIVIGLIIIAVGWQGIHAGNGQLITNGIYRFVRG